MFTVHTWTKICSYFISLIFIIKIHEFDVQLKFYQLSSTHARLIDASPVSCTFAVIVNLTLFIRCSCFIYKLVISTKLAFLSLQNSRCKYSPHAFKIPVQRTSPCPWNSSSKNPPCPRNSNNPSIMVYGYFLELANMFFLTKSTWHINMQSEMLSLSAEIIRKCMSIDISLSFTYRNGFTYAKPCKMNKISRKTNESEQYLLHIRVFHSYDKMDQITHKSTNSND